MRRPNRSTFLLMIGLPALFGAALYLWASTPPEAARLLPECDAMVYANLKPLRAATHFDKMAVTRSPEFQQFIDVTGIMPERDLDAAAFALHRMAAPNGPNGPVAYSEIFQGRFDGDRLSRYLGSIAGGRETYAGHTIFTVPVGDPQNPRSLRIAQLSRDTIAASNAPTPEQIHAMLDRHRGFLTLAGGPTLLAGLYGEAPAFSSAWAIGQLGLPFSDGGFVSLFGMRLPLPEDTPFIASMRYLGSVRLRVEALARTPADAAQTAQALSSVVSLLKTLRRNQKGADSLDMTLSSLHIDAEKDRVVLTANLPNDLLRQLATPAP